MRGLVTDTGPGRGEIRIDSREALSEFRRRLRRPLPVGAAAVVLDDSVVAGDAGRARELEHRMNRSLTDCGCDAGAATVLATALGLAVRRAGSRSRPTVRGTLGSCGLLVGAALVGKVAGLAYQRLVLVTLFRSIDTRNGYGPAP